MTLESAKIAGELYEIINRNKNRLNVLKQRNVGKIVCANPGCYDDKGSYLVYEATGDEYEELVELVEKWIDRDVKKLENLK